MDFDIGTINPGQMGGNVYSPSAHEWDYQCIRPGVRHHIHDS